MIEDVGVLVEGRRERKRDAMNRAPTKSKAGKGKKKKEGTACRAPTKNSRKGRLGFLGLAAEKCRHVQVVRGDFVADFADILLDLVDDVGQRLLLRMRDGLFDFPAGFPGLGQEGRLLEAFFLLASLKPAAITVIFTVSFMASSCTAPKIMLAFSCAAF